MNTIKVEDLVMSMTPYEKLMLYGAGALGKDLKTKVKMQKLLFFCTEALPEIFDDDLFFDAHKKGPYSEEIEALMAEMEDKGLMTLPDCTPTDLGSKVYAYVIPKEPVKSIIENYKELITTLSEDEMLTLIYVTYPDYRINSEEWDRLKQKRVDSATSMLRKQAISFSKALEIADLDPDHFVKYLRSKNIRWRDA